MKYEKTKKNTRKTRKVNDKIIDFFYECGRIVFVASGEQLNNCRSSEVVITRRS